MTHVVDALGPGKGPDLDQIALAMVEAATKVDSAEAVSVTAGSVCRPCCNENHEFFIESCADYSGFDHYIVDCILYRLYLGSGKICVVKAGYFVDKGR